jgi:cytochrome c oxidase assembly protein subunit 15
MIHRYLAMTVGVLILVMAAFTWRERARAPQALPLSSWWPTLTLAWVVVQGLFGKYTVTLKLYPAIVTLHLIGGLVLMVLLAIQHEAFRARPLALGAGLRRTTLAVAALVAVQIALGGWVSTNYAVLACAGFPQCNGQWWPSMDAAAGFTLLRHLGQAGDGGYLPFEALVAIHMAHRLAAVVVIAALLWLGWRLRAQEDPALGRFGRGLAALAIAQLVSGLSNVVLDWPIVAALAHSAGAAALVLLLSLLLARGAPPRAVAATAAPVRRRAA